MRKRFKWERAMWERAKRERAMWERAKRERLGWCAQEAKSRECRDGVGQRVAEHVRLGTSASARPTLTGRQHC
jgi:hypothetical protein